MPLVTIYSQTCLLACTGPNSSDTTDTDSHDDGLVGGLGVAGGGGGGGSCESCSHNGIANDHHSHSGTPNLPAASPESSTHSSDSEASGVLEYSSAVEDALDEDIVVSHKTNVASGSKPLPNYTAVGRRVPENGTSVSKFNSDENLHRDFYDVSDTDRASLHPEQYSSSVQRRLRTHWSARRLDSDFSTAPLSSETSDMDTSGHEKLASDGGGSTSDLTSLSRDSHVSDLSSEVFSALQQRQLTGSVSGSVARPSSGESSESKKASGKSAGNSPTQRVAAVGGAPSTTTASPPVSKRPLKASLSSPLRNNRSSSPKEVSAAAGSRTSLASRVPPRPKPPVATKPIVKPKPPILAASTTARSGAKSPQPHQRDKLRSAGDSDSVDMSTAEVSSVGEFGTTRSMSEQRVPMIGSSKTPHHNIRKASSDTNILAMEKGTSRPAIASTSATFVPRKLSNVWEESEDKESESDKATLATPSTRPARFSPTPRPQLLPTKSKLHTTSSPKSSSQTTPFPLRPKVGPKSPSAQHRIQSPSGDTASDSASSLPCSPVAPKRKPVPPQKPSLLPRKPGLLLNTSSSEGNLSIQPSSTATGDKPSTGVVAPPEKPHTKRRPYNRTITVPSRIGQAGTPNESPSNTPSVSPMPPVLPPRSPVLQQRTKELLRSSGSLSASQPTLHTTTSGSSSSSQEDAMPPPRVPYRKVADRKSEAVSPTGGSSKAELPTSPDSPSGVKQAPPVARRLKPSPRETSPPVSSGKKSPRRPPPSPPLSPSPPPAPSHTQTIGRTTTSDTCTTDPASQKRHSLFSSALSPTQIADISSTYEVFDSTSEKTKRLEELYQQSVKSSMEDPPSDTCTLSPDANQGQGLASARKPHSSHYEMTFLDPNKPPKLLRNALTPSAETSSPAAAVSPLSSDDAPPPLPTQPIPKRKERAQQPLLKRGPIKMRESTSSPSQRSDEGARSDTQSVSSECSLSPSSKDRIYDVVPDTASASPVSSRKTAKARASGFFRKITRNGLNQELKEDGATCRREAKSFSTFTFRRSNSDRFNKNKLPTAVPVSGNASNVARQSVHRTPSVDKLDDRMERSVKVSSPQEEGDSSSDDEDEETVQSPTQQGSCIVGGCAYCRSYA